MFLMQVCKRLSQQQDVFFNDCMNKGLSDLHTYQRGLAPGVLVPKFSCTAVCCWPAPNQHPESAHNQCGSFLCGESEPVFEI